MTEFAVNLQRLGDATTATGQEVIDTESASAQISTNTGNICNRQRNADRTGAAATRTPKDRHHHALCNGETAKCEAGT